MFSFYLLNMFQLMIFVKKFKLSVTIYWQKLQIFIYII